MTYSAVTFIDGFPVLAQPLTDMSAELAILSGQANSEWIQYLPPSLTWTASSVNPSLGNGLLEGEYQLLGSKGVHLHVGLTIGTTTTPGTGYWIFNLPFNAAANSIKFSRGVSMMDDISAQGRPGTSRIINATQVIMENSGGAVTGTSPAVPANPDRYSVDIIYYRT